MGGAGLNQLILIGRNDAAWLGEGWHPAQDGPGGLPCRWMSQQATVKLAEGGGGPADIFVAVSAPGSIKGMAPGLSVYADGTLLGHQADLGREGVWHGALFGVTLPPDCGALRLAVEHRSDAADAGGTTTPLAFVPHEVLGNGDLRQLGVQVSMIRITRRA